MRHASLALAVLLFLPVLSHGQVCSSTQYDMLQWFAPQLGTVNGHYNIVEPFQGAFYWVKSDKGYPWDVDVFDRNYIYHSITEYDWNDPHTFKKAHLPEAWTPRCIDIPDTPGGKLSTITIDPSGTYYDIHTSCSDFATYNLGYEVNEVWGPNNEVIGTLPAADTLTLSYRYSCDSSYNNCKYKESYDFQQANGLVRWTYYILQNGVYVQQNQTIHGAAIEGSTTPVHPCWK